MNLSVTKLIIFSGFFLFSNFLQATDDLSPRVFYSYESNGGDYFSSVGVGLTFKDSETNLGVQLNTSLGYAEVLAEDGYLEDYASWEGGLKLGYFSNISIYVEGGIDLSELFFHDLRYDDYEHHHGFEDDLDAYVGFGIGFGSEAFQLDLFVRAREIDSKYWEAESDVFSGVQISANF